MSGLFGRTPLAFVFYSRALVGKLQLSCQQRNPQVIESQPRVVVCPCRLKRRRSLCLVKQGVWDTYKTVYSNGPILYRYLVIGSLVATSKASMRSVNRDRGARGWRILGIVPETKPTLRFSVPRAKRNPRKLTASKYQYHASVYILQTVGPMLPFYYQIRRKRKNAADTTGNPMSAGEPTANQRDSSKRLRGHPT